MWGALIVLLTFPQMCTAQNEYAFENYDESYEDDFSFWFTTVQATEPAVKETDGGKKVSTVTLLR